MALFSPRRCVRISEHTLCIRCIDMHLIHQSLEAVIALLGSQPRHERGVQPLAVKIAAPVEDHNFQQRIAHARRRGSTKIGDARTPHILAVDPRPHDIDPMRWMHDLAKRHVRRRKSKRPSALLAMFDNSIGDPVSAEPARRPEEDDGKFHDRYEKWQQRGQEIHNVAEVIIGKQRHGPIGTVRVFFDGTYTKFDDLAAGDQFQDDGG